MTPALILSSDSHVFEPPDLWTTRIDRAFRDRAPRKFGIHIGHMGGPLDEMRKLSKFADAKGFDPKTIMRTVNLGFYLGADAKGAARADEVFRGHWGGSPPAPTAPATYGAR